MTKNNQIKKETKSLESILLETGFRLPVTEDEVQKYEEIFGSTDVLLPKDIDSPDFLLDKQIKVEKEKPETKVVSLDHKKNDYFKKLVLAAEIAFQLYDEPTFGHKKFVKVNYLCEQVCAMQLSTNYVKYAAGPLDPKQMYTIDAEFKKRKWFIVTKRNGSWGYQYHPGENIDEYKKYYPRYFKSQEKFINRIINLFKKEDSDFCEIVATLFFIWKKGILENCKIEQDFLISEFYNWGEQKKRFKRNQLLNAIAFMQNEQIVPCA